MKRILVIEDEKGIADIERDYLELEGYDVTVENNGVAGLRRAQSESFDLMILDLMLPDIDGYEICQKVRKDKDIPILMVSAKTEKIDKLRGFGLGADDYITKPFRPLEMVARVKAQLRRYKKYNPAREEAQSQTVLSHAGLSMDVSTHECTLNEKPLELTPTEFSILRILLENKGRVVSAEEMFHRIWQDEYFLKGNNTITVHIRHLREKLGDSAEHPKYIRTVWGVGYRIDG